MKTRLVTLLAAAPVAIGVLAMSAPSASAQSKFVEGWDTVEIVDLAERTYCIEMKTVASDDGTDAFAKAKVRLSKGDFCNKRVQSMNAGSELDVTLDGTDDRCFDDDHNEVSMSGTKVLKAVASDRLFGPDDPANAHGHCDEGFHVFAEGLISVGKATHDTPVDVPVEQDGPDFPPLP